MKKTKLTLQELCSIAVFTAVLVIMAQICIPMPFGVPMTMQTFAVTLTGIVLGPRNGTISVFIYLLLGAVGVPVFTGFNGGLQAFWGPTGGFLLSFPIMAFLAGLGAEHRRKKGLFPICIILGTVVNFAAGTLLFCLLTHSTILVGFSTCVLPFIPTTAIKTILAAISGLKLRRQLNRIL
ncbi:MAG: biotin transporter BioY [Lachnospiraceae bacterium]|nr:biotin transporter BioY [Lachnospiraceae bacterium]